MESKIKEMNLNSEINSYLSDRSISKKSKSDFLIRLAENWKISSPKLSNIYGFGDAFINKHIKNPENGIKYRDIIKFSKEYNNQCDTNLKKDDCLFLDYEGILNLNRIFNSELSVKIYKPEGEEHTLYDLDSIIRKQQDTLEKAKSFEEKRVSGLNFLKEIKEFYGFNTNSLAIFCNIEEGLMYTYLDETTKFNSMDNLHSPKICRDIATNLFRHDTEKSNLVANLIVGIKQFYTNENLFNSILNKELSLSEAIFIYRYQEGLDRNDLADKLGCVKETLRTYEFGNPPSLEVVKNFATNCLNLEEPQLQQIYNNIDLQNKKPDLQDKIKGKLDLDLEIEEFRKTKKENGNNQGYNFGNFLEFIKLKFDITYEDLSNIFKISESRIKDVISYAKKSPSSSIDAYPKTLENIYSSQYIGISDEGKKKFEGLFKRIIQHEKANVEVFEPWQLKVMGAMEKLREEHFKGKTIQLAQATGLYKQTIQHSLAYGAIPQPSSIDKIMRCEAIPEESREDFADKMLEALIEKKHSGINTTTPLDSYLKLDSISGQLKDKWISKSTELESINCKENNNYKDKEQRKAIKQADQEAKLKAQEEKQKLKEDKKLEAQKAKEEKQKLKEDKKLETQKAKEEKAKSKKLEHTKEPKLPNLRATQLNKKLSKTTSDSAFDISQLKPPSEQITLTEEIIQIRLIKFTERFPARNGKQWVAIYDKEKNQLKFEERSL